MWPSACPEKTCVALTWLEAPSTIANAMTEAEDSDVVDARGALPLEAQRRSSPNSSPDSSLLVATCELMEVEH